MQVKLTGFGMQSMEHKASKDANLDIGSAEDCESELCGAKEEILMTINNLRSEFLTRLDGILTAVEETKKELVDCTERLTVEDEQAKLKEMVQMLERRNKTLEEKVIDMETRSRLVNLPEGAEVPDPCSFLEGWLPEVLDLAPLRRPLVLERAHRVRPRRDTEEPPNFDNEVSEL